MNTKSSIGLAALVLLVMATMFAMAPPAQAVQDLKITDYNIAQLVPDSYWTPYGSSYLLGWNRGQYLDATYKTSIWIGSIQGTTVADNYGGYWGECVSLVKALSKNNLATSNWIKGRRVMTGNVAQGTAIATFNSNGQYSGHAAIFNSYLAGPYPPGGEPPGMVVWDQNYVATHAVGKHTLYPAGGSGGVSDADSYYVVQVP